MSVMVYYDGGSLPKPQSYQGGPDEARKYWEERGWISWEKGDYTIGPKVGFNQQVGAAGLYCVTNGTLYPYVGNLDIYMCPAFRMKYPTYYRGYSMISMDLGWMGKPVKQVLFADDSGCSSATADSQMVTNDIGRIHGNGSLTNGNVVYLDGHVEKW